MRNVAIIIEISIHLCQGIVDSNLHDNFHTYKNACNIKEQTFLKALSLV
jgi:hypothetical protein